MKTLAIIVAAVMLVGCGGGGSSGSGPAVTSPRQDIVGTYSMDRMKWESYDGTGLSVYTVSNPARLQGTMRIHSDGRFESDVTLDNVATKNSGMIDVFWSTPNNGAANIEDNLYGSYNATLYIPNETEPVIEVSYWIPMVYPLSMHEWDTWRKVSDDVG